MPEHNPSVSESPKKHIDRSSTRYLCGRLVREHMLPYKKSFAIAFLCMAVMSLMTGAQAKLIEPVIDEIFVAENRSRLFVIGGLILLVSAVRGGCAYGSQYLSRYLGMAITVDIQKRLYRHLVRHDYAFITGESSGKMLSRFTNDIVMLRGAVSGILTACVKESLTLIVLLALMFYQSWQFSLIAFSVFPIAVYPVLKLGRRMRKVSRGVQSELGRYTERLAESLHNIIVIKTSGTEEYEARRAEQNLSSLLGHYRKAARTQALASPIMETLGGVAIAAVICYGGLMVIEGQTTAGKFTSFLTAVIMAYKPLKSLSSLNSMLQEGMAAADRLFALLDTQPALSGSQASAKLPAPVADAPHIRFENVSFSYGGETVLDNISLDIPRGATVALAGPSGGGKSSLLHILMRLYAPAEGKVTVNGADLLTLNGEDLYGHIAYVSQKVMLFDATVAENIAYARPDAAREEIEQAARAAAAHDFITELPQGYDTKIGEDGMTLSGGQRQRIALARAIARNAPLLIMDEATSALDNASERIVKDALVKDNHNRTVIMVAHRLSTIQHADIIAVIDKGRIVEQGTHEELLEKGGLYAELHRQAGVTG